MRAMMIRLPIERGMQLAAFADEHSLAYGEAIGLLLDHGAKTGLAIGLALPGIEIAGIAGNVEIKLGGFVLRPVSVAQARSLAGQLRKVATTPGAGVLDLDLPDTVEISRRGQGVIPLGEQGRQNNAFSRVFSCGVARALADRVEEAADMADRVVVDCKSDVAELMSDLRI